MDQDRNIYIVVDRVGAPYRVLLYQPGIRFIHLSNSKGLCLQHLGSDAPCSCLSLSLSSSLLLSLQYLSKLVVCSYYCSMFDGSLSASINFLLIVPFIPLLNFSTNGLLLYSLPLTALLNSYTNSSIVFSFYFNLLNSATFIDSLFSSSNSFLIFIKNSPTILLSRSKKVDLTYFIFLFIFYFLFDSISLFSIFRTTRVRVDQSHHHISHLMAKSQDRLQDLGEFSRRFENK